jgi:hypothetical protein
MQARTQGDHSKAGPIWGEQWARTAGAAGILHRLRRVLNQKRVRHRAAPQNPLDYDPVDHDAFPMHERINK